MRVAIALGANLGDREAAFRFALDRLSAFISNLEVSTFIETAPEGEGLQGQPSYLNAVAVGDSKLSLRTTLDRLLAIEQDYGRQRPYPNAPRTLDLDLILVGDVIHEAPDLSVPHPRFRERRFVLEPLVEIAPEMIDPVTGLTAADLLKGLKAGSRGES